MMRAELFDRLIDVSKDYFYDANVALSDDDVSESDQQEYDDWCDIIMALETMKEMDWSSSENKLREENAILRKILHGIQSDAVRIAGAIQNLRKEDEE